MSILDITLPWTVAVLQIYACLISCFVSTLGRHNMKKLNEPSSNIHRGHQPGKVRENLFLPLVYQL